MDKEATLLGFAKAGKTTYLAALWQSLRDQGTEMPYELMSLPADRKYLNAISDSWLQATEMPRTRFGAINHINITLRSRQDDTTINLNIPDLSGEMYEKQLQDRYFSADISEPIIRSSGLLLFINPSNIISPALIEDGLIVADRLRAPAQAATDVGDSTVQTSAANAAAETPNEDVVSQVRGWDFSCVPSSAALVELLQVISFLRKSNPARIAVIVSAWDLLESLYPTPNDYIEAALPLLAQYMACAAPLTEYIVFGVSAQGGSYDNAAEKATLLAMDPGQRVKVVSRDQSALTVMSPLLFAMG